MAAPKQYALNQCALYKLGSKRRLALLIGISLPSLLGLGRSKRNYREFPLPEEICPFTGKKTKERWVQEPKPALRRVHERIQKLVSRVRPPDYAHGAVKGKSYRSNAEAHREAKRVATFDIRTFYPMTSRALVRNFFADKLQCASDVADLLVDLCCFKNDDGEAGLPTGSPLSPTLSLCANKPLFDCLQRYAEEHDIQFTCYVDDLTFSGLCLPRGLERFVALTCARFGHKLASNKTKTFRADRHKLVTGVVIMNNKIRVPHIRFQKARAIMAAIDSQESVEGKLALQQKLAGLLGEAAFLDSRFEPLANHSYLQLKLFKEEAKVLLLTAAA